MSTWLKRLVALKACPLGLKRAARYESFQALWDALDHGDWMMWALAHATNVTDSAFMGCAEACAAITGAVVPEGSREKIAAAVTAPYRYAPLEVKMNTWKQLADVVRSHFPQPPELPHAE